MEEDIFTPDDLEFGSRTPTLGPAYKAANRASEEMMQGASGEQLKPAVDKATEVMREALYYYVETFIMGDLESNISGHIKNMVDRTVRALLTGESWALEKYVMCQYHDGEEVRKAVAVHGGEPLLMKRIEDLEKYVARLTQSLEWMRR